MKWDCTIDHCDQQIEHDDNNSEIEGCLVYIEDGFEVHRRRIDIVSIAFVEAIDPHRLLHEIPHALVDVSDAVVHVGVASIGHHCYGSSEGKHKDHVEHHEERDLSSDDSRHDQYERTSWLEPYSIEIVDYVN